MTPTEAASRLLAARAGGQPVPWRDILPASAGEAYAIQDATLAQIGPIGGWKVGARGPDAQPICAPLPAFGLLPSGVVLTGTSWQLRGIEVELALRVGRDLGAGEWPTSPAAFAGVFDAALPVIEVVETRLAGWHGSDALAQLGDLQSHGALVLGDPVPVDSAVLDLRQLAARLDVAGSTVATTRGGNPAEEVWRLLAWLARQADLRGQPLRAGQVVTTGSCTGLRFAPAGARVQAELAALGGVEVQF